ncbi:MAG: ThiF family adenylyltransferase [Planctomycetota bacterium]|nr:ThiF family adenylyltransferase [Planctomycetota bacterium]
MRFAPLGVAGQRRLRQARVGIVGLGALGSAVAEQLARAGVGYLRLIDRDVVEASNLPRQALYTPDDAEAGRPKALAAAAHLARLAPDCTLDPVPSELDADNAFRLLSGLDLVIDGLDTFAARHLLNDACCQLALPWVHGAVLGAQGQSLAVIPGDSACWRCLQPEPPEPADSPTCDSVGVIIPAVRLVAAWQAALALQLLVDRSRLRRALWACDLWTGTWQQLMVPRDPGCRSCGPAADRPALAGAPAAVVLCGRQAVQLRRPAPGELRSLAARLGAAARILDGVCLRVVAEGLSATCFPDGRVLVQGTGDPVQARAWCDRWLGG